MLSKKLFLGISLVSAAAAVQAQYINSENCDYFSGPYVRAGALYQSTNDKYTIDSASSANKQLGLGSGNTDLYMGRDTWGGDLGLGYGRLMNRTYVGAEIYGKAVVGKQKLLSIGGDDAYVAMKTPFTYGAMAKVGYTVTPQVLTYVGLGAERTQFRLTGKAHGVSADADTYHKWAVVPSIGMDVALNCNWQVGTRLSYAHYGSIDLNDNVGSINPRRATFGVNVSYHFV